MEELEKIVLILDNLSPAKVVRVRIDKVILNIEEMSDGGTRIIYSDGFMKLLKTTTQICYNY